MKIAVASSDGIEINEHFGRAEILTIITVDEQGDMTDSEKRPGLGSCGGHDEGSLRELLQRLSDCSYVLASRIGPQIQRALALRDISAFELSGSIIDAVQKIRTYESKQKHLKTYEKHVSRVNRE